MRTLYRYPKNYQNSTSTLTKERLYRNKSTARKTYNCQLFMKCANDKKEYQICVLNCGGEAYTTKANLLTRYTVFFPPVPKSPPGHPRISPNYRFGTIWYFYRVFIWDSSRCSRKLSMVEAQFSKCYTQRRRDNFPGTQFLLDKLLILKKGLGQGIPKQLVELK